MYLQQKHGDKLNGNVMDGDPALALAKFHSELQREALEKLKKDTNPDLWAMMMKNRFPSGICGSDNTTIQAPSENKDLSE
jgi:hypothetical protein